MGNKANYTHAINFINLFHTLRDQGNKKIQQNPEKWGFKSFQLIIDKQIY